MSTPVLVMAALKSRLDLVGVSILERSGERTDLFAFLSDDFFEDFHLGTKLLKNSSATR